MSVLSRNEIIERLGRTKGDCEALTISPLLDPAQLDHDSVDLRLGTYFIAFSEAQMPSLDLHQRNLPAQVLNYQTRVHVPLGHALTVHPSSLVLGCTLEYIRIPADVSAQVLTRSTWGRLGLMIATAVWVHPLFTGCLTLEIANHGHIPVSLPPGVPLAQLVLYHAVPADERKPWARRRRAVRYTCATRPWHAEFQKELADLGRARLIGDYHHGRAADLGA